ncbi:MAG: hypothetical protein F4Y84_12435 [Caldilineaceae bacterium SB0665_bin_25]|nr:hypothetical protein [Caldilineaceae bacterium SB0665_bin_25]
MSSETTLLARIAPWLTGNIENVAVEALGYILNQSPAARKALAETVRLGGGEIAPIARVWTQVVRKKRERPDLVCFDETGEEQVLIEAKFDAVLAKHQPNQYLRSLPHGKPAALLFVAPTTRRETLWPDLCARAEAEFEVTDVSKWRDSRSATINDGVHRLQLISWASLLDRIAREAHNDSDINAISDIRQLRGLTDRMDADAFLPWHLEDMGPGFARRVLGLEKLVKESIEFGESDKFWSTAGLSYGSGWKFYGRYFRIGDVVVWFGIHLNVWKEYSDTPLWLSFEDKYYEKLMHANLARFTFESNGYHYIPIELPTGVEYDAVLDSVVASLKSIADQLKRSNESQPAQPQA